MEITRINMLRKLSDSCIWVTMFIVGLAIIIYTSGKTILAQGCQSSSCISGVCRERPNQQPLCNTSNCSVGVCVEKSGFCDSGEFCVTAVCMGSCPQS
jgi:hypothetical protein